METVTRKDRLDMYASRTLQALMAGGDYELQYVVKNGLKAALAMMDAVDTQIANEMEESKKRHAATRYKSIGRPMGNEGEPI